MKLSAAIDSYVQHRRTQGFIFHGQALELRSLGRAIGNVDIHHITVEAVTRALDRPNISQQTWRRKYALLKHFFRHWRVMGLITNLPMPPPRGLARSTFVPYILSKAEVRSLISSVKEVPQNSTATLHPETLRTFLIFLYATGARSSEAFALRESDVNIGGRTVNLRWRGKGAPRMLPIGADLRRILWRYRQWRLANVTTGGAFFVRRDGRALEGGVVHHHFNRLLEHAGLVRRDRVLHKVRLYDLRPTFAVHRISEWICDGKNLNRLLPALAAYLGQSDLNATEKFLSLTPTRFKKELDKLSPAQGGGWSGKEDVMRIIEAVEAGPGVSP